MAVAFAPSTTEERTSLAAYHHLIMPVEEAPANRLAAVLGTDNGSLERTASVLRAGGTVAFPFNGIYVLYADADNRRAAERVAEAKNRPADKLLAQTCLPESVEELADLSRVPYQVENIVSLWRDVFALGLILPAARTAPRHLVRQTPQGPTVMPVWVEYAPLRRMLEHFRYQGGRALAGTSANKSGDGTHIDFAPLWSEFKHDLHVIVKVDFPDFHPSRRQSTSVVDLTGPQPRLHRLGSMSETEIRAALERHGFPPLTVGSSVIQVAPRAQA